MVKNRDILHRRGATAAGLLPLALFTCPPKRSALGILGSLNTGGNGRGLTPCHMATASEEEQEAAAVPAVLLGAQCGSRGLRCDGTRRVGAVVGVAGRCLGVGRRNQRKPSATGRDVVGVAGHGPRQAREA